MTDSPDMLAPLLLRGRLQPTIWGGRNLARVAGKSLPEGATIGESWETAEESVVRNPPYEGRTLGALVERFGERLIGTRAVEVFGRRFPLLTKFIDARQPLSVQVHPNDDYAAAHENGKLGKTETWYILRAEPGAQLVYGLARDSSPEEVRRAIAETRLEDLLYSFEAREGDIIFVPAGTVHAIGAGVLLYELQEYSDVTYRLYDYSRLQSDGTLRDLHVDKGLDVMRFGRLDVERVTPISVPLSGDAGTRRILAACSYFVEEELRLAGESGAATSGLTCHIVTVLDGMCRLHSANGELSLFLGDTVVVPASIGEYILEAAGARVLRSYVPEAENADLLAWRAAQPFPIEE
ncbi:MAG: type I phosphomannose isomerase catalytic subunit [Ktedonobacterales bacterium]